MDSIDDLVPSFNVGVLFEPVEGTRLGLTYRSKVDFELDGNFEVRDVPPVFVALGLTDGDVEAKIPIPQLIRASIYQQLTDRLAILADLGWEDWSENDFTPIQGPAGRTLQLPRDWRDTWHFGLGLEWRVTPAWLLQTGVAHDTSPVRSRHKNFPDMPADRQWRFSMGVVHDWSESLQLAFNYTWIDLGKARIDIGNDYGRLIGEYDQNRAHVFSFSVALTFSQ
jgi:long-chain fatty acid transport protein